MIRMIIGIVVALSAAAGGWFAWESGMVGDNNRAPTEQNLHAALRAHFELRQDADVEPCVRLPSSGAVESADLSGVASKQVPGQYRHEVSQTDADSPQQRATLHRLRSLSKAGFVEEVESNGRFEYRLTAASVPYVHEGFCARVGRLAPVSISEIAKVGKSPLPDRFTVTYTLGIARPEEWFKERAIHELFKDDPKIAQAVTGRKLSAILFKARNGWIVEEDGTGRPAVTSSANPGQDLAAIRQHFAGLAKENSPRISPLCLVLPNVSKRYLNGLGAVGNELEARSQKEYVAALLTFDRINSFYGDEEGRTRLVRRLAKEGILVSESLSLPAGTVASGYGKIVGARIYRVAPALEQFVVPLGSTRTMNQDRFCLRFADAEPEILSATPRALEAPERSQIPNAYYVVSGRLKPTKRYDWIEPLVAAGDVPEVNAGIAGLVVTGGVSNRNGKLSDGGLAAIYPESVESISKVGDSRALVAKVTADLLPVTQWFESQDVKEILAGTPRAISALAQEMSANSSNVFAGLSKKCDEYRSGLDALASPVKALQTNEIYGDFGVYMATRVETSKTELRNVCQGLQARLREAQRSPARFPVVQDREPPSRSPYETGPLPRAPSSTTTIR